MKRAFVDYYRERDISPVRQDIADRARHFGRRAALYRFLGLPPFAIEGASVLEFGPGSGDNALYTASLGPARYVLVDGNPRGVAETRARLATSDLPAERIAVVESDVNAFASDERFDVVLAEGLIPFQHDPEPFARRIAAFVRPGGVLVVTCADAASAIGEIGRRLLANRIAPPSLPYAERVRRLVPVFAPHLATLHGMSRSVEDWIDDNIAHPLTGRLFSIADAIDALAPVGFTIYGASPHFLTDWRWYKTVYGDAARFNERARERYLRNVVNLLDYRITIEPHGTGLGRRILDAGDRLYAAMQSDDAAMQSAAAMHSDAVAAAVAALRDIAARVAPLAPGTAESLTALATALAGTDAGTDAADAAAATGPATAAEAFHAHFGRGQQYLSFIREVDDAIRD